MPTVKQLRDLAILTQAELAEEVGVSVTTISHWETGSKRPRASNIRKLAKVLGVSPRRFLQPSMKRVPSRNNPDCLMFRAVLFLFHHLFHAVFHLFRSSFALAPAKAIRLLGCLSSCLLRTTTVPA